MYYLLLFHDNNVYANVPQFSYIHTVHVLLSTKLRMIITQLPTIKTLPAEAAYFKNKQHSVFFKIKINIYIAMIMKVAARIH